MAMEDSSVTSLLLENAESKQMWDMLSPEDVAWADSCLIKDPEMSETNLGSLKDALLDVLGYYADSISSSPAEKGGYPGGPDIEIIPSSEKKEIFQNFEMPTNDLPINEATESHSNDHPIGEKTDTMLSKSYLEKAFLPTYKDVMREIQYSDFDDDLVFPQFVTDPSAGDIFMVWDLDLPVEEDELVIQLNKALLDSSLITAFDDSGVEKGLKEESVDDLIAGIADLSLKQNYG